MKYNVELELDFGCYQDGGEANWDLLYYDLSSQMFDFMVNTPHNVDIVFWRRAKFFPGIALYIVEEQPYIWIDKGFNVPDILLTGSIHIFDQFYEEASEYYMLINKSNARFFLDKCPILCEWVSMQE